MAQKTQIRPLLEFSLLEPEKAKYLEILETEGKDQLFRFLAELGIVEVKFVKDGSLAVEELIVPTPSSLRASLEKTQLPPATQDGLVSFIQALPTVRKISALRRVTETTFVVNRFEYAKSRSARPKFDGYVNHQRTPLQEYDAVYKQLFQSSRSVSKFPENFDLSTIAWEESSTIAASEDVPLKLIVPHDQAGDILQFLVTEGGGDWKIGQRLQRLRETTLPNLLDRYTKQYRDYFSFLYDTIAPETPQLSGNLLEYINLVRDLRSKVLKLYDHFRLPFPDASNPSFHIWTHDPEQRIENRPREPFDSLNSAMKSHKMVVSVFRRLRNVWLRSGVLHDVILCKSIDRSRSLAYVHEHGRSIVIAESQDVSTLARTLEHEVCHVCDEKSHMQLRRKLDIMDQKGFTEEVKACLTLAANKFFPGATVPFTTYTAQGMPEMTYIVTQLFTSEFQRKSKSSLGRPLSLDPDLRNALSLLSHDDWNFLRDLIKRNSRDVKNRRMALTRDYLPFFTSRYASLNSAEEAAELIRLVVNPRSRLEAFHAVQPNDVKREKIKLALSVLSGADQGIGESSADAESRVALVEGWKQQETQMQYMVPNSKPIVVVYVSEGKLDIHAVHWTKSNIRVTDANFAGNAASYLFLLRKNVPEGRIITIDVVQQNSLVSVNSADDRFDIFFYGIEDTPTERSTARSDLLHGLIKDGINFYGQLALAQEVIDQGGRAESVEVYRVGENKKSFLGWEK